MTDCIILEDELSAQKILLDYIEKVQELNCIGVFESGLNIPIELLNKVELLFLDIQLPEMNGLEFIRTLKNPPSIIITSAYSNFALESYELDITDYLLKPFSFNRFLTAVNRHLLVAKRSLSNGDNIFLYADKTFYNFKTSNILYLKAEVDYVKVVSKERSILVLDSLTNLKQKLPEKDFIQAHRSYVVNVRLIETLSGNTITIAGEQIPVGKTYRESVQKLIFR